MQPTTEKVDGRSLRVASCGGRGIDGHNSSRCRECRRAYHRKWRLKHPRQRTPASCAMCDLTDGNSRGIRVFRYPLLRKPKGRPRNSVCIGSVALCDQCIIEHGTPSPTYVRANGLTDRAWRKTA